MCRISGLGGVSIYVEKVLIVVMWLWLSSRDGVRGLSDAAYSIVTMEEMKKERDWDEV